MPDTEYSGGCQCGAVRYAATGEPVLAAFCHCTMCRRAHGAPAVAWAIFTVDRVRFSGTPKWYRSSAQARRGFCAECGTPLTARSEMLPGHVEISIGSLDDPAALRPSFHLWYDSHLPWAEFADGLPRYPEFPPAGAEAL